MCTSVSSFLKCQRTFSLLQLRKSYLQRSASDFEAPQFEPKVFRNDNFANWSLLREGSLHPEVPLGVLNLKPP